MKIKGPLVVCDDEGHEETLTDGVVLEKACQQIDQVGLTLAETKSLLAVLQQRIVERQAAAFLATCMHCQTCGTALDTKGQHSRTLFGTVTLTSPRLRSCQCTSQAATTSSPLMALLPEQVAPELLFMETMWSSLVSYGLTVQALTALLPVDATLSVSTVRSKALALAQRCEAELGDAQMSFIEGWPRDWGNLPIPDGPITVGIDGWYVRDWDEKPRQCEVIVGKRSLAFTRDDAEDIPSCQCFGFVQTFDAKPKRRLLRCCNPRDCR